MSFFGKNIKKIRSIRGLTQVQLADMLEVSRGVVSSYEEGRAEPKIETILKTAEMFSVSIDDLLKTTLTVNQLSGFALPDVSKSVKNKANTISKLIIDFNLLNPQYQFVLRKTIQEVELAWLHYEGYFVVQSQPKNDEVFVIETVDRSYLGKLQMLSAEKIKVGLHELAVSKVIFSGLVIGGYTAFSGQLSIEDRLRNLEQEVERMKRKMG